MTPIKKTQTFHWSNPIAFFFVVLMSYGIYIPWFGLYGDDWIYLWNYHLLGAGSFANFVAADRPYSAWLYFISSTLFGENIWLYHIFLLILRWLCVYLFWRILCLIWPENKIQNTWIAMIFAVYPGFGQQPIVLQFILHFSILALFFLSVYLMLLASIKRQRRLLYLAISLICALNIFSLEYFVGLELLRPVLLWLVLKRKETKKALLFRKVGLYWLPYLAVTLWFFIWRTFIYEFQFYEPQLIYKLRENPLNAITELGIRIIHDLKLVIYNAWKQITNISDYSVTVFVLLIIGTFVLITLYLRWIKNKTDVNIENKSLNWSFMCIGLGVFSLIVAGWPFWITNIPLEIQFPWDRSTLPFMVGSSLVIVGGLDLLIRPKVQLFIVAAIISLAFGWHYQNAVIYREEWNNLRTYFTQLAWRAPSLKEGTIIFSEDIPLYRYSDNDLTAPLNWMYAPDYQSNVMLYRYFDLTTRKDTVLSVIDHDIPINHGYRSLKFSSTSDQIINIFYRSPGCVWVLDNDDDYYPDLPQQLKEMLVLSNMEQIITGEEPMDTLPSVFGKPVEKDWCYYFESADLARQNEDWEEIYELGELSTEQGLEPYYLVEYLPFIEGYAYSGHLEEALILTETTSREDALVPQLCKIWSNVVTDSAYSQEELNIIHESITNLSCN